MEVFDLSSWPLEHLQYINPRHFPDSLSRLVPGLSLSTLTQAGSQEGWGGEAGAHFGFLSRKQIRYAQALWRQVLAKIRPQMNSCGLEIPMWEQSFLRIGIICFWQSTVSFFEGEKKKGVGKTLEISQDLLDMDYVLQNTFLTSWVLTNQTQTDCLSCVGFKMQQEKCHCWIWLGTWTQSFARVSESIYWEAELVCWFLFAGCDCSLLGDKKKKKKNNTRSKAPTVSGGWSRIKI